MPFPQYKALQSFKCGPRCNRLHARSHQLGGASGACAQIRTRLPWPPCLARPAMHMQMPDTHTHIPSANYVTYRAANWLPPKRVQHHPACRAHHNCCASSGAQWVCKQCEAAWKDARERAVPGCT
eukprot:357930-Chlamydomonas_euryale.AAC.7